MTTTPTAPSRAGIATLGLMLGLTTGTCLANIRADLNVDGLVDQDDLLAQLDRWGSQNGHFGDLDLDGVVTVIDLLALLSVWGTTYSTSDFTPSFTLDYSGCGDGTPPSVGAGLASFGSAESPHHAGRVISQAGYRNITSIVADVDISGVTDNFVNAAWYMVNSDAQPIGDTYCDSGGASPWCNEIDFLETDANAITQSTIHLDGDPTCGYDCAQRFEFAYTSEANTSCFGWSSLESDAQNPTSGTHSLVDIIDVSAPFTITVDFDLVDPRMTVTVSQTVDDLTQQAVVYDSSMDIDPANSGGPLPDMSLMPASMETGWWLVGSMWQGYSPGQYNDYWTNTCAWGSLCGGSSYWNLSNVRVTAESAITD